MTTPPTGEPRPDELPSVDSVIHEAREGSWHLPETPPSEPTGAGSAATVPAPARAPAPAVHAAPAAAAHATAPAPAAGHGTAASHAAAGHGAAASHGGGHGEEQAEPLGPIDVEMWGAGIAATIIGLFMAVCFVLATSGLGAY